MDFYADLELTATELLNEFNQGEVNYIPLIPAANDWEDDARGAPVSLKGIARGPSFKYLSDLITQSDIQLTIATFGQAPTKDGIITIDGTEKQIIEIEQVPAAGDPVMWRIFVKG